MTRGRWVALALGLAALLLVGRGVAALVVEQRWYAAFGPGAEEFWRTREIARWLLRGLAAAAAAGVLFVNLAGVVASVEKVVLPRRLGDLEIAETVPGRRLLWGAGALSLVLGVLLALPLDDWQSLLGLATGPLRELEPYTEHDLSFHVDWLPLEGTLYAWSLLVLLVAGALVLACYALTSGFRIERGRPRLTNHVRRHVTALGAALILLLAWGHRLDAYALLGAGSGPAGAFGWVDHRVGLPLRWTLAVVTLLASVVVLRAGWARQPRLAFWVVTVLLGVTFVSRLGIPWIAPRLVASDRLARQERSYATTRALFTRRAYAVDAVASAPAGYGLASLGALAGRVSVWDPPTLTTALARGRRGGAAVGAVGFQGGGDSLRAVVVERPGVAPVEEEGPEFTVIEVDATRADADGNPTAIGSVAGVLADAGQRVRVLVFPDAAGPAIVQDPDHAIVGDRIDGWGARLAHAWARRDFGLAFSGSLDRLVAPTLVLTRDPRERVQALVPFFAVADQPTPALVGDSLHWIVHFYGASPDFPLSQRFAVAGTERAYFRHAGVGIVNAQSGAVTLVADSATDRVTGRWIRRFRALFTPHDRLPAALAAAITPPADGALVQAWTVARFGLRGTPPSLAPRHLTGGTGGDSTLGVSPRPVALLPPPPAAPAPRARTDTLDAPAPARYVPGWSVVLLDAGSRVDGTLVALGGASPRTLWLPSAPGAPRWTEVLDRLRTRATAGTRPDTAALRAQALGMRTLPGYVRAVPVAGRPVFVQPTYDVDRDAPVLRDVTLLAGDSVRVVRDLATSAAGGRGGPFVAAPVAGAAELARARTLYQTLRAALQRSDWAGFGRALDSLGAALGAAEGARPR